MDEREPPPAVVDAGVIIDLAEGPTEGARGREPRLVGFALAVAVVLATAAAALSVDAPVWADRSPRPTSMPTDGGGPFTPAALPVHAVFLDARHGFVTMLRCPSGRFQGCSADLSVTSDGGVTWVRRSLPNRWPTVALSPSSLYVLDPRTLVFDQAESFPVGDVVLAGPPDRSPLSPPVAGPGAVQPGYAPAGRWHSPDGGRSWRRVGWRPVATLAEIPAGGQLIFPPPGAYGSDSAAPDSPPTDVAAAQVLRPDGTVASLAHGPDDGRLAWYSAGVVANDGSVWLTGRSFSDEPTPAAVGVLTWVLRVSRDRGRTWRAVPTPAGRLPTRFFTADGRALYGVSFADEGRPTVTYSRNAGATWHELRVPEAAQPRLARTALGRLTRDAVGYSVAPVPDGGLLVSAGGRLYRLWPADGRFSEVGGAPSVAAIMPAGRWVLGMSADLAVFYASPDGIRWRKLGLS